MSAVDRASISQLRRLTEVYLVEFSPNSPSPLWHMACLYLANNAIRSPEAVPRSERLADLHLCLSGYKSLYPRYPIVFPIIKGLLRMALGSRLLSTREAREYVAQLEMLNVYPVRAPAGICMMVDLDAALIDRPRADMDYVAQEFDDLVIFDELIRDDDATL